MTATDDITAFAAAIGPGPVIGSPPRVTEPAVGARKPARMFSRVVLPHPLGPSRVSSRPPFRSNETSWRAWTEPPFGNS